MQERLKILEIINFVDPYVASFLYPSRTVLDMG